MLKIFLHNLKFRSFHGLYPEEKLLGSEFSVDIDLYLNSNDQISRLNQTVDYTAIYEIVKSRMSQPTELLETVAQDIVFLISRSDGQIKKIHISITKTHPPIKQFEGVVGVSFEKEF